jgi:hypothetical protein
MYGEKISKSQYIQSSTSLQLIGTYDTPGQATKVCVVGNKAFVADGSGGLRVIDVSIPSAPIEITSYDIDDAEINDVLVSGDYAFINMKHLNHGEEIFKILDISNLSNIREKAVLFGLEFYINDISVSGNKACLAEGNPGMRVLDFQNLPYLNEVGSCYLSGSAYHGTIHVQGTYAFVTSGSYLEIYNVSDPTKPIYLNKITTKSYAQHVFVQGNYAYLADVNGGLRIIDVSNPASPVEVGSYVDSQTCTKGVYVSGNYAFLAEHFDGLVIIDISSPTTPVKVGECDTPIHARNVHIQGNYAYVAAEDSGLRIINISNLSSPYETGYYNPTSDVNEVFVKNNYAYLSQDNGLQVLNVSNPSSPSEISFVPITDSYGLCSEGNNTYVASSYDGLRVYDTSNPTSINEVGYYKPTIFRQATDVFIKDNKAYIVGWDYGAGLSIIDVSNPTIPSNSILDTPGSANGVDIKNNYAYVADYGSMKVVNIQNVMAPANISSFPSLGSAKDIVTSNKYAYLANQYHGIQIINIENPASPYQVSQITSNLLDYIDITDIFLLSNYLYVAEYDEITVINTNVPSNPSKVASYWPLSNLTGIYVLGNYIYCAEENHGLMIFNNPFSQDSPPNIQITNPQNNQIISGAVNVTTNVSDDHGILKVDFFMDSTYAISDDSSPYSWTFNSSDYITGSHQIKAIAYDTASQSTEAVINVTIGTPTDSVTIKKPNNVQTWAAGSTKAIEWTTTGSVGNLKIEYSTNGGSSWIVVTNSTTNDGTYSWTIPKAPSLNCFVRLTSVSNPSISDISDQFVIYDPSVPASITVTSPNGGETWTVGSTRSITWTTSGLADHVKVEYSTNSGASWITVENHTHNDGNRPWVIPDTPSSNCKVKISSYVNSNIYDVSNSNFTIKSGGVPSLLLDKTELNFGGTTGGLVTPPQKIFITKEGYGSVSWDANWSESWMSCAPATGYDSGELTVSITASGLSVGNYSGVIVLEAPFTTNSEQNITVNLTVYPQGQTSPPFGTFETPKDNSTVRSSIPVTGWVLDDIGLEQVKIYRRDSNQLLYIGDAIYVEGARPDVQAAYPGYPMNYQAGWGYLMLTNFLPNGGNGTYTLVAKAKDTEGHEVTLGSKTIIVDNANAIKPFGAIDTPAQGGPASGASYVNWGWALTPQPNYIPADGSTIDVYVDGVNIGHPTYNLYRVDVATKFPGYANTNGAIGYFYLDTTAYDNGVHTIQWIARDSAGNSGGIGSRYFKIQNTAADVRASAAMDNWRLAIDEFSTIDVDNTQPILVQKGFSQDSFYEPSEVDDKGESRIRIRELELLKIKASDGSSIIACYQLVGNKLRKMPIGMSIKDNEINWMLGVGYLGNYRFVVVAKNKNGYLSKKHFKVVIEPKFIIDK